MAATCWQMSMAQFVCNQSTPSGLRVPCYGTYFSNDTLRPYVPNDPYGTQCRYAGQTQINVSENPFCACDYNATSPEDFGNYFNMKCDGDSNPPLTGKPNSIIRGSSCPSEYPKCIGFTNKLASDGGRYGRCVVPEVNQTNVNSMYLYAELTAGFCDARNLELKGVMYSRIDLRGLPQESTNQIVQVLETVEHLIDTPPDDSSLQASVQGFYFDGGDFPITATVPITNPDAVENVTIRGKCSTTTAFPPNSIPVVDLCGVPPTTPIELMNPSSPQYDTMVTSTLELYMALALLISTNHTTYDGFKLLGRYTLGNGTYNINLLVNETGFRSATSVQQYEAAANVARITYFMINRIKRNNNSQPMWPFSPESVAHSSNCNNETSNYAVGAVVDRNRTIVELGTGILCFEPGERVLDETSFALFDETLVLFRFYAASEGEYNCYDVTETDQFGNVVPTTEPLTVPLVGNMVFSGNLAFPGFWPVFETTFWFNPIGITFIDETVYLADGTEVIADSVSFNLITLKLPGELLVANTTQQINASSYQTQVPFDNAISTSNFNSSGNATHCTFSIYMNSSYGDIQPGYQVVFRLLTFLNPLVAYGMTPVESVEFSNEIFMDKGPFISTSVAQVTLDFACGDFEVVYFQFPITWFKYTKRAGCTYVLDTPLQFKQNSVVTIRETYPETPPQTSSEYFTFSAFSTTEFTMSVCSYADEGWASFNYYAVADTGEPFGFVANTEYLPLPSGILYPPQYLHPDFNTDDLNDGSIPHAGVCNWYTNNVDQITDYTPLCYGDYDVVMGFMNVGTDTNISAGNQMCMVDLTNANINAVAACLNSQYLQTEYGVNLGFICGDPFTPDSNQCALPWTCTDGDPLWYLNTAEESIPLMSAVHQPMSQLFPNSTNFYPGFNRDIFGALSYGWSFPYDSLKTQQCFAYSIYSTTETCRAVDLMGRYAGQTRPVTFYEYFNSEDWFEYVAGVNTISTHNRSGWQSMNRTNERHRYDLSMLPTNFTPSNLDHILYSISTAAYAFPIQAPDVNNNIPINSQPYDTPMAGVKAMTVPYGQINIGQRCTTFDQCLGFPIGKYYFGVCPAAYGKWMVLAYQQPSYEYALWTEQIAFYAGAPDWGTDNDVGPDCCTLVSNDYSKFSQWNAYCQSPTRPATQGFMPFNFDPPLQTISPIREFVCLTEPFDYNELTRMITSGDCGNLTLAFGTSADSGNVFCDSSAPNASGLCGITVQTNTNFHAQSQASCNMVPPQETNLLSYFNCTFFNTPFVSDNKDEFLTDPPPPIQFDGPSVTEPKAPANTNLRYDAVNFARHNERMISAISFYATSLGKLAALDEGFWFDTMQHFDSTITQFGERNFDMPAMLEAFNNGFGNNSLQDFVLPNSTFSNMFFKTAIEPMFLMRTTEKGWNQHCTSQPFLSDCFFSPDTTLKPTVRNFDEPLLYIAQATFTTDIQLIVSSSYMCKYKCVDYTYYAVLDTDCRCFNGIGNESECEPESEGCMPVYINNIGSHRQPDGSPDYTEFQLPLWCYGGTGGENYTFNSNFYYSGKTTLKYLEHPQYGDPYNIDPPVEGGAPGITIPQLTRWCLLTDGNPSTREDCNASGRYEACEFNEAESQCQLRPEPICNIHQTEADCEAADWGVCVWITKVVEDSNNTITMSEPGPNGPGIAMAGAQADTISECMSITYREELNNSVVAAWCNDSRITSTDGKCDAKSLADLTKNPGYFTFNRAVWAKFTGNNFYDPTIPDVMPNVSWNLNNIIHVNVTNYDRTGNFSVENAWMHQQYRLTNDTEPDVVYNNTQNIRLPNSNTQGGVATDIIWQPVCPFATDPNKWPSQCLAPMTQQIPPSYFANAETLIYLGTPIFTAEARTGSEIKTCPVPEYYAGNSTDILTVSNLFEYKWPESYYTNGGLEPLVYEKSEFLIYLHFCRYENMYFYVANSLLDIEERSEFCNVKGGKFICAGLNVGVFTIENVCNDVEKYCIIFPDDPQFGTIDSIASVKDITDYTLYISPVGIMWFKRMPLNPLFQDISLTNIPSINGWNSTPGGAPCMMRDSTNDSAIIDIFASVPLPLEAVQAVLDVYLSTGNGTHVTVPVRPNEYETIPTSDVFVGLSDRLTRIVYPNVKVISAILEYEIKFAEFGQDELKCARLIVEAGGFHIQNVTFNQTRCKADKLEYNRNPLVFGSTQAVETTVINATSLGVDRVVWVTSVSELTQKTLDFDADASDFNNLTSDTPNGPLITFEGVIGDVRFENCPNFVSDYTHLGNCIVDVNGSLCNAYGNNWTAPANFNATMSITVGENNLLHSNGYLTILNGKVVVVPMEPMRVFQLRDRYAMLVDPSGELTTPHQCIVIRNNVLDVTRIQPQIRDMGCTEFVMDPVSKRMHQRGNPYFCFCDNSDYIAHCPCVGCEIGSGFEFPCEGTIPQTRIINDTHCEGPGGIALCTVCQLKGTNCSSELPWRCIYNLKGSLFSANCSDPDEIEKGYWGEVNCTTNTVIKPGYGYTNNTAKVAIVYSDNVKINLASQGTLIQLFDYSQVQNIFAENANEELILWSIIIATVGLSAIVWVVT